jgi:hypothetical protein
VELALNSYVPTSHAPVAGRGFGVPVQTICSTVLTVCGVQTRVESCVLNPEGHTEVKLVPAPTVGDDELVAEKTKVWELV